MTTKKRNGKILFKAMAIITLASDFGLLDPYVGIMKGVILGVAPGAQLVDLSHDIPPQDIDEAVYALRNASPFFPHGTVHLAIVDPGVGSDRRALLVIISSNGTAEIAVREGNASERLGVRAGAQLRLWICQRSNPWRNSLSRVDIP